MSDMPDWESEENEFERASRARERAEQDQKFQEIQEHVTNMMRGAASEAVHSMLESYKFVARDLELVTLVADCTAYFVKRLVQQHGIPMEFAVALATRQLDKFHNATRAMLPSGIAVRAFPPGADHDPDHDLDHDLDGHE